MVKLKKNRKLISCGLSLQGKKDILKGGLERAVVGVSQYVT